MVILNDNDNSFLLNLSKKLREQETLGTAKPVLYKIKDVEYIQCSIYDADWVEIRSDLGTSTFTTHQLEDIKRYVSESCPFSSTDELQKISECNSIEEIVDLVEDNEHDVDTDDFYIIGFQKQNVYYGSFLTSEAAHIHLKSNSHHYTDEATVYCEHVWRNPELEQLLNIIENNFVEEAQNER